MIRAIFDKTTGEGIGYEYALKDDPVQKESDNIGVIEVSGIPPDSFKVVDGAVVEQDSQDFAEAKEQQAWFNLRAGRRPLLAQSDWTQVPDAPVDQSAWASYRQALRDLPNNTTDPFNPDWPVPPSGSV